MLPLDFAIEATRFGLSVFPIPPLSSEPASAETIDRATIDLETIASWPAGSNYGIATGGRFGNVFAVELAGAAGSKWWRARGLPNGVEIRQPSGVVAMLFSAPAGQSVASATPGEGVRVIGEGGWVLGAGSIVPTGTVRGELVAIPLADFDPNALEDRGAYFGFIDAANGLPERLSDGQAVGRALFAVPRNADEARRLRGALLRAALEVGLGRMDAAAVAWGCAAGKDLRDGADGAVQLMAELHAAETQVGNEDRVGAPVAPALNLLKPGERDEALAHDWWLSRFAAWAEDVAPGHAARHRLSGWLILSAHFRDFATVERLGEGGSVRLRAGLIDTTHADGGDGPLQAVLRALPGRDVTMRRLPTRGYDFADRVDTNLDGFSRWLHDSKRRLPPPSLWAIETDQSAGSFALSEPASGSDARAVRFATELEDAMEAATATHAAGPVSVSMSAEAIARHKEFKAAIEPLITDRRLLAGFADSVRVCATLAALADGLGEVGMRHELVALLAAEEWLENLGRITSLDGALSIAGVRNSEGRKLAVV